MLFEFTCTHLALHDQLKLSATSDVGLSAGPVGRLS